MARHLRSGVLFEVGLDSHPVLPVPKMHLFEQCLLQAENKYERVM